jgi:hypothetical protein
VEHQVHKNRNIEDRQVSQVYLQEIQAVPGIVPVDRHQGNDSHSKGEYSGNNDQMLHVPDPSYSKTDLFVNLMNDNTLVVFLKIHPGHEVCEPLLFYIGGEIKKM